MTVRGVLTKLVNDGLLFRVLGKGTYVAPNKISAVSPAYRGIREQLEAMGYTTTTQLVSLEKMSPPSDVRNHLNLTLMEKIYEIVRLRTADGSPISLHRSYIPTHLAPGLDQHDIVNEQLCVVLEKRHGLRMRKVREHLEAVAVNNVDAKHLGMHRGDPVLLLEDLISDEADRPFEYSKIIFRGNSLRINFNYDVGFD